MGIAFSICTAILKEKRHPEEVIPQKARLMERRHTGERAGVCGRVRTFLLAGHGPTALASILVVILGILGAHSAYANLRIHGVYLYDLKGPTKDSRLKRQNDIFCDLKRGELYVVDTGNHCVRIFGKEGIQIFEFGRSGALTVPLRVGVSSTGDIYVLQGGSGGRRIDVFDFRGRFLEKFEFKGLTEGEACEPSSIAIDSRGIIYVSDPKHGRLLAFDREGRFQFEIVPEMSEKDREEVLFGNLMIDREDRVYLPVSTLGTVFVFDSQGKLAMTFGIKGGGPGKLAFPVDVVADNLGHLLVLDKQRHCISVFDRDGRYLTEFGGMGTAPGWFFYPSGLEIDRYGRIYVSQRYGDKVQVLKLKEEIE